MPSLICLICGPRSSAHRTGTTSSENTAARIGINFVFMLPPRANESTRKYSKIVYSVKLFDMFSRLSVKALEQASTLDLAHYTLIYDFSRFFVLKSRFPRELFDSERNVLGFWDRTLWDCALHVGPIHEVQQRGIFHVEVTPIDSISPRTILSCQSNGFAKCLYKPFNLAARVNQQAARDCEIYAGADIKFQALIVGQYTYFDELASAFQIEEVVFVARRRIDLTF